MSLTNLEDMAGMDEELGSDRIHACGITYSLIASDLYTSFLTIQNYVGFENFPVYLLKADDRATSSLDALQVITGGTLDPAFQDILEDDEAAMLQSLRAFLGRRT